LPINGLDIIVVRPGQRDIELCPFFEILKYLYIHISCDKVVIEGKLNIYIYLWVMQVSEWVNGYP